MPISQESIINISPWVGVKGMGFIEEKIDEDKSRYTYFGINTGRVYREGISGMDWNYMKTKNISKKQIAKLEFFN